MDDDENEVFWADENYNLIMEFERLEEKYIDYLSTLSQHGIECENLSDHKRTFIKMSKPNVMTDEMIETILAER